MYKALDIDIESRVVKIRSSQSQNHRPRMDSASMWTWTDSLRCTSMQRSVNSLICLL